MKKEKVFSVSVIVWCFSMLTLLDYLYQTGFGYSDIKVTRKTHTVVRSQQFIKK